MTAVPLLLHVIVAMMLLTTGMAAQEETSAVSSGDSGTPEQGVQSAVGPQASDEVSSGLSVPVEISGKYYSLVGSGGSRSKAKLITGAIMFMSAFDDNPLNRSVDRIADMQYTIAPRLAIESLRPQTSWKLAYAGGLSRNLRLESQDVATHDLRSEWMYSLGRHLQLDLRQTYTVSSNPFTAPGQSEFTHQAGDSGPPVLGVTPTATRTWAEVAGDLSWQMSRTAMLTVRGGASWLRFGSTQDKFLVPTDGRDLRIDYARQLTRRNLLGASVRLQDLSFPAENVSTRLETIQYFHLVEISKSFDVSFYAGPQHRRTTDNRQGAGFHVDSWSHSGGVALGWQVSRWSARATFEDSARDGNGLTTAVRTRGGKLELQSRVARNWRVGFSSGLADSQSLEGTATQLNRVRTFSQNIWVQHRIRHNVEFSADYRFAHQLQHGSAPAAAIDRNRFQVAFSYEFMRPWGR